MSLSLRLVLIAAGLGLAAAAPANDEVGRFVDLAQGEWIAAPDQPACTGMTISLRQVDGFGKPEPGIVWLHSIVRRPGADEMRRRVRLEPGDGFIHAGPGPGGFTVEPHRQVTGWPEGKPYPEVDPEMTVHFTAPGWGPERVCHTRLQPGKAGTAVRLCGRGVVAGDWLSAETVTWTADEMRLGPAGCRFQRRP